MAIDLNGKTIFDFCKDEKLLLEILGAPYTEEYYKTFPPVVIAEDLCNLAAITHNEDMFESAKRLYQSEEAKWESEIQEAMRHGILLD